MILSPSKCSVKMSPFMKEMVTLNKKEQKGLMVFKEGETGKMPGKSSAGLQPCPMRVTTPGSLKRLHYMRKQSIVESQESKGFLVIWI